MRFLIGIVAGAVVAVAAGFGLSALLGTGVVPDPVHEFVVTWQGLIAGFIGGIVAGFVAKS